MQKRFRRQGDVMVEEIEGAETIPTPAKKIEADNGRVILAYGEVTGHAHALPAAKSALYEWQGERLLEIKEITCLTHEEHAPIEFEPGFYRVIQQREYHPEAIRNVAD